MTSSRNEFYDIAVMNRKTIFIKNRSKAQCIYTYITMVGNYT